MRDSSNILWRIIPIAIAETNIQRRVFALAKVTAAVSLHKLADYEKRQVPRDDARFSSSIHERHYSLPLIRITISESQEES